MQRLKITFHIYYLTVSLGPKSRAGLAGSSAQFHKAAIKMWLGCVFIWCSASLPSSHGYLTDSASCSCKTETLSF